MMPLKQCWILTFILGCVPGVSSGNIKPVVLIPGNGGNQLDVRVDSQWEGVGDCDRSTDWGRLWLDVWNFREKLVPCFADKMEIIYDRDSRASSNKRGVHTRVPGFGDTDTVEWIDPSWSAYFLGNVGKYFAPVVEAMVSWGYTRGETVKGAPYDFRYAPHTQGRYFSKLRAMIERMYTANSRTKVTLVAHSAGGLYALYFLNQQDSSWKNQYIDSLVTLGTPWSGATLIFRVFASGYDYNISTVDPLVIRKQQRTTQTNMVMVPRPPAFNQNTVFVQTDNKDYTLQNVNQFFDDIGYPIGKFVYSDVRGNDYDLNHPGVDVHCWYGTGVSTPGGFKYSGNHFPESQPDEVTYTDGDGTVTTGSLDSCRGWIGQSDEHQVEIKTYNQQEHLKMLSHPPMLKDLKKVLLN